MMPCSRRLSSSFFKDLSLLLIFTFVKMIVQRRFLKVCVLEKTEVLLDYPQIQQNRKKIKNYDVHV